MICSRWKVVDNIVTGSLRVLRLDEAIESELFLFRTNPPKTFLNQLTAELP